MAARLQLVAVPRDLKVARSVFYTPATYLATPSGEVSDETCGRGIHRPSPETDRIRAIVGMQSSHRDGCLHLFLRTGLLDSVSECALL